MYCLEENKKKANIESHDTRWIVNIGGYNSNSMQEKHEFGLVTTSTKLEEYNIAKYKWLIGCKKKHKDDI